MRKNNKLEWFVGLCPPKTVQKYKLSSEALHAPYFSILWSILSIPFYYSLNSVIDKFDGSVNRHSSVFCYPGMGKGGNDAEFVTDHRADIYLFLKPLTFKWSQVPQIFTGSSDRYSLLYGQMRP